MEEMLDKIFEFERDGITYYYIRKSRADSIWTDTENGKTKFTGVFTCSKCHGEGHGLWRRDNGICYSCHGLGYSTVKLNVTKNKSTAERRLQTMKVNKEKRQQEELIRCEKRREEARIRNTEWTLKTYTESFYLILDTLEKSTYEEKEYIKSKGGRWNPAFSCWWVKASDTVEEDLKDFKLVKLLRKNLMKENGEIDSTRINIAVLDYNYELNLKKRGNKYEK